MNFQIHAFSSIASYHVYCRFHNAYRTCSFNSLFFWSLLLCSYCIVRVWYCGYGKTFVITSFTRLVKYCNNLDTKVRTLKGADLNHVHCVSVIFDSNWPHGISNDVWGMYWCQNIGDGKLFSFSLEKATLL